MTINVIDTLSKDELLGPPEAAAKPTATPRECISASVHSTLLQRALEHVGRVQARPLDADGHVGYLFSIGRTATGEARGSVSSRDALRIARAEFTCDSAEGEGAFVLPVALAESVMGAEGLVEIEARREGDARFVRQAFAGSTAEVGSFDPRLLSSCDRELDASTEAQALPAAVLREALRLATPYIAKATDHSANDLQQTVELLDATRPGCASGDGCVYAGNGVEVFYFRSDALRGRRLAIHGQHVPVVLRFLASAGEQVQVRAGAHHTFLVDERRRVLGWCHHKRRHEMFKAFPDRMDTHRLLVSREGFLQATRYVATLLPSGRQKVRVTFDPAACDLRIHGVADRTRVESAPVAVVLPPNEGVPTSFSLNANVNRLVNLAEHLRAHEFLLRIAIVSGKDGQPESAYFRALDEFWLSDTGKVVGGSDVPVGKAPADAHKCVVTRILPAMV